MMTATSNCEVLSRGRSHWALLFSGALQNMWDMDSLSGLNPRIRRTSVGYPAQRYRGEFRAARRA